MKIVLVSINARYVHSNLAHLYIMANFDAPADIVHEEFSLKDSFRHMVSRVAGHRPDLVAFSTYIWNIDLVRDLARDLKELYPQCAVLLGGPEADYRYREFVTLPYIDYVFRGEGDAAFSAFIQALGEERPLPPYVVTRDRPDGSPALTADLTLLRPPYTEPMMPSYRDRMVYYETSRGCPFHCTYCLSAGGAEVRFFDPEQVAGDFELFVRSRIKTVKIVDRTFNHPEDRALRILDIISILHGKYGDGTTFHLEILADVATDAFISRLCSMPRNAVQIEVGIQSTCPATLQAVKRPRNHDRLRSNLARIIAAGNVHVHVDLIAGLPYEGPEEFRASFNFAAGLAPHYLQVGFLKRLEGAPLSNGNEHGMIFSRRPPYELYANRYLTCEDMTRIRALERIVDLYYNTGRFIHVWQQLVSCHGEPYTFCIELSQYIDENVTPESSFAPRSCYRYLYEFIRVRHRERQSFLVSVLVLDYLLQERPRHLPEWFPEHEGISLHRKLDYQLWKKHRPNDTVENEREYRRMLETVHVCALNLTLRQTDDRLISEPADGPHVYLFRYPEKRSRLEPVGVERLDFLSSVD